MTERHIYWKTPTGVGREDVTTNPVTIGATACSVGLTGEGAPAVAAVAQLSGGSCVLRKLTRTRAVTVNAEDIDERSLRHGDQIEVDGSELLFVEHGDVAEVMLRLVFTREDTDTAIELETWAPRIVIGRNEGSIHVDDGSVSGTHIEIENHGEGMRFVRDLDSTNGSELNGAELGDRTPFELGDTVKIGRVSIELNDGGAPPQDAGEREPRTVRWPGDALV